MHYFGRLKRNETNDYVVFLSLLFKPPMTMVFGVSHQEKSPVNTLKFRQPNYSIEQAEAANDAFDKAVKTLLRDWIEQGTVSTNLSLEGATDKEEFLEHGALRSFFKHRPEAFERLLEQQDIARHLLRPIDEVYFEMDAYEPLLAKFEKRIYNIAAHRENLEVPFRYSPISRQGAHGDTIKPTDLADNQPGEDIGAYFGTRRTDSTALSILAHQLRWEAIAPSEMPIHVITEGYMDDSLRRVRATTEQLGPEKAQPHCFVIQRRHAADDRHLGAALLIMDPQKPDLPRRIIFCDTLSPGSQPPWWSKFKDKIDAVFPQPDGQAPASGKLENGGVKLQRLHDGVPVRHQDIDCAFYTASMCLALIQLVRADADLMLNGSIDAIVSQMTARMPEYYEQPNQPKEPMEVREVNVVRRWNTGWQALKNMMQNRLTGLAAQLTPDQPLGYS